MDPWSTCQQGDVTKFETLSFKFEDDFSIPISQTLSHERLISALPDSDQYLATLESKLKQLKSDSNIVEQLIAKREACMQQLLAGENVFAEEIDLDQPVNNLKNLLSSRQALNQGEIVDLLKHDQLENTEEVQDRRDSQEIRSP
ncbi:uncharacterized protein LOC123682898 isoform X2 [Harmonia axyridis]|uniref:uncharacterized protein LOC123682898 isoform X2 n=1 Tax=Harmonia axyridis TaxID=115357 RepID=UPI001E278BB3|nr:uncharacterized protein LOC123682898 isoform X2 [Harmonia axyridis]